MSSFIVRYYYFLKDDAEQGNNMTAVLEQQSMKLVDSIQSANFLVKEGFYFNLSDFSGKMHILGISTPPDLPEWNTAWLMLENWEKQANLEQGDLMGILTVLVDTEGKWPDLMPGVRPNLSCRDATCVDTSASPLFRLPTSKKDKDAVYVYSPPGIENVMVPLLGRRLPIMHGQLIFLHELDSVWIDRNYTICREKDELEKELIRILHTKLVMQQPALAISEELEKDIEILATAFAKLVADKKLIGDGSKRMESMLTAVEKQFLNEPALGMDEEAVSQMLSTYHNRTEALRQTYDNLDLVVEEFQAAIEVVQSKIQVMNSRTNIDTQVQIKELLKVNTAMQKKSLVFQYAAGLIEFIILAYYSHALWLHLSHTAGDLIPAWIQFDFLVLFSANTVLLTHYLAEYIQGEVNVRRKVIYAGISLLLLFILIVLGTIRVLQH